MTTSAKLLATTSTLTYGRLILQTGSSWLSFADPLRIIFTYDPGEITTCFQEIDDAVTKNGLYAAGFMTYEAAAAYNLSVHEADEDALPLLWFGLYDQPQVLSSLPKKAGRYDLEKWRASLNEETYRLAIAQIKHHIALGDTYQVNFTMHLRSRFSGDPWAFYHDLSQAQQAQYTAYLDLGRNVICSASPELFFRLDGNLLGARPMKGTAVRGLTLTEDKEQVALLQSSSKNRAENVMIVDMIRNDFGRIAEIGSVTVPSLFTVERYPTLLQMTSSVTAKSRASLPEIMEAVFPCASITGAPKVRTMEIIKSLEPEPRGIYTGTIGYWGPNREALFNVAIRTVVIDQQTGEADYGVGSGIVWDSKAANEYAECRLKTKVLVERFPIFELLETLLWTSDEGYFLLDYHLRRLADSAYYFNYPFDEQAIRHYLQEIASGLQERSKVRLSLQANGAVKTQVHPLKTASNSSPVPVCLANTAVDSQNVWLYHKTSRRQVYEQALAASPQGHDIILWNERGEVTEASSSNVIVELGGQLITPPVSSGLLAGTFRRHLLEQGQIKEGIVTIDDLRKSPRVILVNSVRRWREAVFVDTK